MHVLAQVEHTINNSGGISQPSGCKSPLSNSPQVYHEQSRTKSGSSSAGQYLRRGNSTTTLDEESVFPSVILCQELNYDLSIKD
jgi:hypothetical protein